MDNLIQRFIVWYLKKNNTMFEYSNYTVRIFTTKFYENVMEIKADYERIRKQFDELAKTCNKLHAENVSQKAEIELYEQIFSDKADVFADIIVKKLTEDFKE